MTDIGNVQLLDSTTLPLKGIHLIEASAGTGKTYNIVRIYLRLLLEKEYTVEQILVMTFTVAATAEIRNRLNAFLRDVLENWDVSEEPVVIALRNVVESKDAKLLLQQAILRLDEAAIYTIHGFCKRALSQQAFFSGMSFSANMEADGTLLKKLAVEDWYRHIQQTEFFEHIYERWSTPDEFVRHWNRILDSDTPLVRPETIDTQPLLKALINDWPTEREQYLKLNKATARSNQQTLEAYQTLLSMLDLAVSESIMPSVTKTQLDKCFSTAKKKETLNASFQFSSAVFANQLAEKTNWALDGVEFARKHIQGDKVRLDQLDFNDLITYLRKALAGKQARALQTELRSQFPAALVDEFQDTDPDQYQILQAIYQDQSEQFLCMIGDPKQAIYAFRGGDVFAYLSAKRHADYQWTMNTNYRSSPAVIEAYNRIFLRQHTEHNDETFKFGIQYRKVLADPDKKNPTFSDEGAPVQWVAFEPEEESPKGVKKSFQQTIAQWVSSEIVTLLDDVTVEKEPVKPGDIALLVRSYSEATLLQSYLADAGLPSVYLSSRQNVFQTEEAQSLHQFLKGIWQFENDRYFIAALASSWIGLDTSALNDIVHDEHLWSKWQNQLEKWREDWHHRGLMSMLLDVLQNHYRPSGENLERSLTNRLHLAERLQMESSHYRLPDALLHWFTRALEDDSQQDANLLRLESDEALIKIITMHGAKGLEYPIVFLPFVSYFGKSQQAQAVYSYHDRKTFDLQLAFLANNEQKQWTDEEEKAELIRLLYVATTRAEKRLYINLAPFTSFGQSALGQTLGLPNYNIQSIRDIAESPSISSLVTVNESAVVPKFWKGETEAQAAAPAEFNGHIERDWWLSSFSALTRHVGHSVHSTPDRDEDEISVPAVEAHLLRFRLQKGAEAGNLLHDTLEHCDFSAPDFDDLYQKAKDRYSTLTETFNQDEFTQWLSEILTAPIGHSSLSKLPLTATLRESEFYFPMNGNSVSALTKFISQRRGSEYQLPERNKLKGMMHGFIDLIFEKDGRYFVADYKSTHLGDQINQYNQETMQHSIRNSSYDVQYSIYALALHRYLKVRLPDYRPSEHFGGVYYFYLRGMNSENNAGIFYDQFTENELEMLDRVFSNDEKAVLNDE